MADAAIISGLLNIGGCNELVGADERELAANPDADVIAVLALRCNLSIQLFVVRAFNRSRVNLEGFPLRLVLSEAVAESTIWPGWVAERYPDNLGIFVGKR